METLKLFEQKFHDIISGNVESVLIDNEITESENVNTWVPEEAQSLRCSYCRTEFNGVLQQKEHYKLDWHRYNLRLSLAGKQPISEEEFDKKTGQDNVSSISGSDSEDDEGPDAYATAQGKIFLRGSNSGKIFAMYTCLLYATKKEEVTNEILTERIKHCCDSNKKWTILMLGGGHFAGAVFEGSNPILHKTFHCYTVRAGQGGSQSARDGRSATSHPKSAGASLRRYNEQALVQHVREILETWRLQVESSSLVMYRASGPYNRSVLFGGNPALLDRSDRRLRTIPFSTRRPTFTEVKRVHSTLSQAQVFDNLEIATKQFSRQKEPELKRSKAQLNRGKPREVAERPDPMKGSDSSSDRSEGSYELSTETQQIPMDDLLQPFCNSLDTNQWEHQQPREQKKKKKSKKSKAKKLREQEEKRKCAIIDVLVRGDLDGLRKIVEQHQEEAKETEEQPSEKRGGVDEELDEEGNTMLHMAALNEHSELLTFLLEAGADLCAKNTKHQTPYSCTKSKEVRETLRQFAKDNPEKFNYNKAQIPTNSLTSEELAEKRKEQRKVKKEKEKIKREQDQIKRKEQEEKDRFLKLSDREKRALAAERRILQTGVSVITSRCFLCAADIAGKVPFEYGGNRFCTIDCLKAHRMANPMHLS